MALYLGDTQVAMTTYPDGGSANLQQKTETYSASSTSQRSETVLPDTGYDGLSRVDINIRRITTTNLTAANIKSGTTVSVGDTSSLTLFASVTGTYTGPVVSGTFTTGSSTATVQSVTIPYTGTGYPIMVMVEVSPDMYDSSTTWSSTIQRYAVGLISIVKPYDSAPAYGTGTGTNNYGHIYVRYKNSTSSATSYTNTGSSTVTVYSSTNPSASSTACIKFSDATTMKVFIASTSYGLMASTTYKYTIVYSA